MCVINFTHKGLLEFTVGNYGLDTQYYAAIFAAFEPYLQYFINSHYICIESQLPINYDLVRMSQHITTYLMTVVRNVGCRPLIVELDPHLKSQMLGGPPKMTKVELKAWAHKMGVHFLRESGEHEMADFLEARKKGDDMGDVILYEKCLILLIFQGICKLPHPSAVVRAPEADAPQLPIPGDRFTL